MEKQELRKLIAIWFEEDIRDGDHTSLSCIPPTQLGCQQLIIKDTGVDRAHDAQYHAAYVRRSYYGA